MNSWGLCKSILIKSIVSPKIYMAMYFNSHCQELHLTWFVCQIWTILCMEVSLGHFTWGTLDGVPQSSQSFSYLRMGKTPHLLFSPLDLSPFTLLPLPFRTPSLPLYALVLPSDSTLNIIYSQSMYWFPNNPSFHSFPSLLPLLFLKHFVTMCYHNLLTALFIQ